MVSLGSASVLFVSAPMLSQAFMSIAATYVTLEQPPVPEPFPATASGRRGKVRRTAERINSTSHL